MRQVGTLSNSIGSKERALFSQSGDLYSSLTPLVYVLLCIQSTLLANAALSGLSNSIHRIKEFH